MRVNHNLLAVVFPIVIAIGLAVLVYGIPEIGIAPQELTGRTLLKVAVFFACWPLGLRFLGGWDYSVTADARKTPYGMVAIACAVIIGCALVIAK